MPKFLIDPGHGGVDPGCEGNGQVEKAINLAVGVKLYGAWRAAAGDSVLTRHEDIPLSLAERAVAPNIDFALVLHCDTSADPTTGHLRTYARGKDVVGMGVATEMAMWTPLELGPPQHTVTIASPNDWTNRAYNVLRHHDCPAVLVEMGFLSNPKQAAFLASARGQLAVVSALMAGLALAWSMMDAGHNA